MGREGIPNAQSKKGDPKKLTPGTVYVDYLRS